jgi:hypothetical protein
MHLQLRSLDDVVEYADVVCIVSEWLLDRKWLTDSRVAELLDAIEQAYENEVQAQART